MEKLEAEGERLLQLNTRSAVECCVLSPEQFEVFYLDGTFMSLIDLVLKFFFTF